MGTEEHPYAEIISTFKPNDWQLEKKEPVQPKPLSDTPLTLVDTETLLYDLITKLKEAREVAISIYYDKTSFRGDIGMLVFSTRDEDFIVDALKLKEHMMILNEVMMSTDIVKVMFINIGSKNSNRKMRLNILPRLQRDFGIYLVNVFDLGLASTALGIRGLLSQRAYTSSCVKEFFGVNISEGFLKDRCSAPVRPISAEMKEYAQEETHYLLSLYDVLRNKLLEKETPWYGEEIMDVYKKCAATAAVLYNPSDFELKCNAYRNHLWDDKNFTWAQRECFRLVHNWRWKVAEETDKQLKDIMPTHHMKKIAEVMPKTVEEIEACCEGSLSPRAKSSVGEIKFFVHEALRKYPGNVAFGKRSAENKKSAETAKQPTESKVVPPADSATKQPASSNPATSQPESKKNKDKNKQRFTGTGNGQVRPMGGPMGGLVGGPMGGPIRGPMGGPMGGPMRGPMGGPMMRPTAQQVNFLMNALQDLIGNGQPLGPPMGGGPRGGRFQPYNNQRRWR